jgi:hypothetical protein
MNRVLTCALLVALAAPLPAQAGEFDALVRGSYKRYQSDKQPPYALGLIRPHASKRLAALIDKEERCTARTRELCNLEFDVIVNAQDWELKGVRVESATPSDRRMKVTALFTNIETPQEIVYSFVRETGHWKLDDIESRTGPRTERWTLSRLLAPQG